MNNVLVTSVHPDDETLGVGGTILKHKHNGDKVYWLNITGITEGHSYGYSQQQIGTRENEINKVISLYGFEDTVNLNLPTQLLDTFEYGSMIKKISEAINFIKPNIIYIPNRSDVHSDHRIAFHLLYSCTKSFRHPFIQRILMYETLSETEFAPALPENAFMPNVFVDVSDFIDKKLKIMSVYKSELMQGNLPRSLNAIKSLAAYRGSRIGVNYAEAFVLLYEKL